MQAHVWAFIFVVTTAAFLVGCSFLLKNPKISVKNVTPVSFSLTELDLSVTLDVYNPNSLGITLKTLSFDIYYQNGAEWVYLCHGEQAGIKISPGENEVTIPITIRNIALASSLLNLIRTGEITFQVRGVASPDFFGIAPKVPFTRTVTRSLKDIGA